MRLTISWPGLSGVAAFRSAWFLFVVVVMTPSRVRRLRVSALGTATSSLTSLVTSHVPYSVWRARTECTLPPPAEDALGGTSALSTFFVVEWVWTNFVLAQSFALSPVVDAATETTVTSKRPPSVMRFSTVCPGRAGAPETGAGRLRWVTVVTSPSRVRLRCTTALSTRSSLCTSLVTSHVPYSVLRDDFL